MDNPVYISITYFAILFGFGLLTANLLRKRKMPDTFFLLMLGMLFGPTFFSNPAVAGVIKMKLVDVAEMGLIPDFLRILALIMVVFTGSYNLNFRVFKRYSGVSLKLAFIGVIFSTVFLGIFAHLIFGIELIYAFLLAAVVSGTGSGVVFAFERALSKSKNALNVLKVESIFNSPLSVLVPILLLDLVNITSAGQALIEPLRYLSQFWQMISVGVGTGLIVGLATSYLFKGMHKEYGPLFLFSIALITYALAINVGGSGMLAVAICGLVSANFGIQHKNNKGGELNRFEGQMSEMLRISVFMLLGAQVALIMSMQEFAMMFLFFIVVFVSRPIFMLPLMGKMRGKFSRKDLLLMSFVAPRGLSAAAMIPMVALAVTGTASAAIANLMVNAVFMVILLSVLVSTIVASVCSMERFNVGKRRKAEPEPELEAEADETEDATG